MPEHQTVSKDGPPRESVRAFVLNVLSGPAAEHSDLCVELFKQQGTKHRTGRSASPVRCCVELDHKYCKEHLFDAPMAMFLVGERQRHV